MRGDIEAGDGHTRIGDALGEVEGRPQRRPVDCDGADLPDLVEAVRIAVRRP